MRTFKIASITFIVLSLFIGSSAEPVNGQISAEKVNRSIKDAISYLVKSQQSNGDWGTYETEPGGTCALTTLALLNAGVPKDDPTIKKAVAYLRTIGPNRTYATSLRTMVFVTMDPKLFRAEIRAHVKWLIDAQRASGPGAGGWGYVKEGLNYDNSNSQFALLALHEATTKSADIKVPPQVWMSALKYWQTKQNRVSGGFGYKNRNNATGSMTCAGVSSLIIAYENLQNADGLFKAGKINCCGGTSKSEIVELAIEQAIKWLGDKFSAKSNPGKDGGYFVYYYLYGMERAGRLSGRRFLGDHDWYREGAEWIVGKQKLNGSWTASTPAPEEDPDISTSLALLFLSKGRRPVLMAKYRYGDSPQWDGHRKGVHFLTRETEKSWEQDLTWLTVDGRVATVNDLLESPILFLSGANQLDLDDAQKIILKDYVEQGGFIFAEARDGDGCDGTLFDQKFRSLMGELFPNSELTPISAGHPIWFADEAITPSPERPLLGVQASCRTSIVYCPNNLSCFWQLKQDRLYSKLPVSAKEQVDYCTQLGVNVAAYATNRNLKQKLARQKIRDSKKEAVSRDQIQIAKLLHDGGADDAPVALGNLLQSAGDELKLPFSTRRVLLPLEDKTLPQHPVLFMHGKRKFEFNDTQREILKQSILKRDFFIFADSICGKREFFEAFKAEIKIIFPDLQFERIPVDHPILTEKYRGSDIRSVTLRSPSKDSRTGRTKFLETRISPVLYGLKVNNKFAIVLSQYDLSCALENTGTVECQGYSTEDAKRIGINVLLYALQR